MLKMTVSPINNIDIISSPTHPAGIKADASLNSLPDEIALPGYAPTEPILEF